MTNALDDALAAKEKRLCEHIGFLQSVVVAYSGGVDSSLVAQVAHKVLGAKALAVLADSPSLSRFEWESARDLAQRQGFFLRTISTSELENDRYRQNDAQRCFYCKSELYSKLKTLFIENVESDYRFILDGTNCDDVFDFRPGRKAAADCGVISPLVAADLSKAEVRILARRFGLPNFDKPASPCLSSRFLHGIEIDKKKLRQVELAEDFLRRHFFLKDFRVRHMGGFARLDVAPAKHIFLRMYWPTIEKAFERFGFSHLELYSKGFISGSLSGHHQK